MASIERRERDQSARRLALEGQVLFVGDPLQEYSSPVVLSIARLRAAGKGVPVWSRNYPARLCPFCGDVFVPKYRTQKTCGRGCRDTRRRSAARKWWNAIKAKGSPF